MPNGKQRPKRASAIPPPAAAAGIPLAGLMQDLRCGVRLLHRGGDVVEKGQTVMLAWLPRPDRRLADAISIDALRRAAAP